MLPRISIILERILFNHFFERVCPFLSSKHFGFRSGRGTTIQLLQYVDQSYKGFDANDDMHAISTYKKLSIQFVTKQYYLNYNVLVLMLFFLAIVSSYLGCRTQQVKINRSLSVSAPFNSGVPQGSVLGPLLFLI